MPPLPRNCSNPRIAGAGATTVAAGLLPGQRRTPLTSGGGATSFRDRAKASEENPATPGSGGMTAVDDAGSVSRSRAVAASGGAGSAGADAVRPEFRLALTRTLGGDDPASRRSGVTRTMPDLLPPSPRVAWLPSRAGKVSAVG
jgi:hypothetical protein